jgi:hypothetical protein
MFRDIRDSPFGIFLLQPERGQQPPAKAKSEKTVSCPAAIPRQGKREGN